MQHHSEQSYREVSLLAVIVGVVVVGFIFCVWSISWHYDRVENTTARTNRFTGEVQILSLSGWHTVAKGAAHAPRITRGDLRHVELNLGQNGWFSFAAAMMGSTAIQGSVYNPLLKPLNGEILFHVVQTKGGKVLADRRLRSPVNWPAQQVSDIHIETGLNDVEDAKAQVTLEPAP
jgi:hypothetical protein